MSPKWSQKRLKRLSFVAIGTAVFWTFYFSTFSLLDLVGQPQEDIITKAAEPVAIFGSFFNTFSSPAAINTVETNLYQDEAAAAIFYPPDYDWQLEEKGDQGLKDRIDSWAINGFQGPYNDKHCLGNNCLEQKGNKLLYQGRPLAWPFDTRESDLAAVSLGALDESWLIGFTFKDGEKYRGEVYRFDGRKFELLKFSAPFNSSYFGLFGFGGIEDDFLVIYGGYEGIAYRVRGRETTDISRLFNIRTMDNGFKAEVVRIADQDNINWYIFSSTLGRPSFIKLWQNRTDEIVGEAVFDDFFTAADESAIFQPIGIENGTIRFLARVRNAGADSWRTFVDRGFKNSEPGTLVFNPINHDGDLSSIIIKKVAISRLDIDASSASKTELLFSSDGQNWRKLPLGRDIDFVSPSLQSFWLKVTFPAYQDKFYSPFLGAVLFDYYCQK